jgi:hypothetical protein
LVQRPLAQVPRVRLLRALSQPAQLLLVRLPQFQQAQVSPAQWPRVQVQPGQVRQVQLPPVQRRVRRRSCLSPLPMLSASLTQRGLRAAAVLLCIYQFSYLLQWLSLFQVIFYVFSQLHPMNPWKN